MKIRKQSTCFALSILLFLNCMVSVAAAHNTTVEEDTPTFTPTYCWFFFLATETAAQTYQQIIAPSNSAEVTIERKDFSIKNEDGSFSAKIYYDLPHVTGGGTAAETINTALQADFEQYQEPLQNEVAEYLHDKPYPEDTYLYTVTSEATQNGDGVLSIRYETTWFMGGVQNTDHYGMTFDLSTGRKLTIPDLIAVSPDVLLRQLQPRILDKGTNLDSNAAETVAAYTLQELTFYIRDRELWVCIPTYELAGGFAGSFEIPCQVYIAGKSSKQVTSKLLHYLTPESASSWVAMEYEPFSDETRLNYTPEYIIYIVFSDDGTCRVTAGYHESYIFLDDQGRYTLEADGTLLIDLSKDGITMSAKFKAEALNPDVILLTQTSEEGLFFHHKKNHQLVLNKDVFD